MSPLGAIVTALLCGALGILVPRLVAAVPEPALREDDENTEEAEPEDPKPLYADLAARPRLATVAALVSVVAGALIGAVTGWDWSLVWLVPLVPVAVALSYVDWHTRLLPTRVVVPATLAAVGATVVVGLATGEREALVRALVAMVVVRTFFWVLWFVRSAGMGFGDVRLAALIGLVLGWVGWGPVAIGVWIGFVAFSVPGLLLAVVRRDRSLLKQAFPFGPFMVFGALVGLVWGPALTGVLWA